MQSVRLELVCRVWLLWLAWLGWLSAVTPAALSERIQPCIDSFVPASAPPNIAISTTHSPGNSTRAKPRKQRSDISAAGSSTHSLEEFLRLPWMHTPLPPHLHHPTLPLTPHRQETTHEQSSVQTLVQQVAALTPCNSICACHECMSCTVDLTIWLSRSVTRTFSLTIWLSLSVPCTVSLII